MNSLKVSGAAALFSLLSYAVVADDHDAEVGSTLNQKVSVELADIPAEVLAVVKAKRPDMTVSEAEYEVKHDDQYYDVEGTDADGNEIELDLILEAGQWMVVEIQRDLSWDAVPEAVQIALHGSAPGVVPDRIIESDQDNGTIVYEFFTRDDEGKETKYEVALEEGEATFLADEWEH